MFFIEETHSCFIGSQIGLFSHDGSTTQAWVMLSKTSSFAMPHTGHQQGCRVRMIAMLLFLPTAHTQATGPGMLEEEGKEERMFGQLKEFCHMGQSRICQSGPCTEKMACWKDIHPHLELWMVSLRIQTGLLTDRGYLVKVGMTR